MPSDLQITNIRDQANANSAITIGSDGQITVNQNNPTITLGSNATFPTKVTDRTEWYPLFKPSASPSGYGTYVATLNVQSGSAVINGTAPTGFSSVVSGYVWFITANSGTVTYSANMEWQISSSSNNYNQHALTATALYSQSSAQNKIWRKSIIGIGTDGQRFEQVIAADDVFGINVAPSTAEDIRMLGIEITWRF